MVRDFCTRQHRWRISPLLQKVSWDIAAPEYCLHDQAKSEPHLGSTHLGSRRRFGHQPESELITSTLIPLMTVTWPYPSARLLTMLTMGERTGFVR